jgi:Ca2+-binding EF-hand superfamily protein
MSEDAFNDYFDSFLLRVREYSPDQRDSLFSLTRRSLESVLTNFPAPRKSAPPAPANANETVEQRKILQNIETALSEKLYERHTSERAFFLRFDSKHSGYLTCAQFRAAVAMAGVNASDSEMNALIRKYDTNGNGTINYEELLRYLQAKREIPRSTSADAFTVSAAQRRLVAPSDQANFLHAVKVEEPVNQRIARGLELMRDHVHTKKSNPHHFFQSLQNAHRVVLINELIPLLTAKLGFPQNLCSNEELRMAATQFSQTQPGYLTYPEFLSFFMGDSSSEMKNTIVLPSTIVQTEKHYLPYDSPALLDALLKINNSNTRQFFKRCDNDGDGLINTSELISGMIEVGLSPALMQDEAFRAFLESFTKKKNGLFSYSEFMRLLNSRLNGQSTKGNGDLTQTFEIKSRAQIPVDCYDLPTIMEIIIRHFKAHNNLSLETALKQFDLDCDGKLDENELYSALRGLGVDFPDFNQFLHLFDALDDSQEGVIPLGEFAKIVINPYRNQKFVSKDKPRHSSNAAAVPIGSINGDEIKTPRKNVIRLVGGAHTERKFDVASQLIPLDPSEADAEIRSGSRRRPATAKFEHQADLSFPVVEAPLRQLRPGSKDSLDGKPDPSKQSWAVATEAVSHIRGVGHRSSIDFANDHGFQQPQAKQREASVNILEFDPNSNDERPATARSSRQPPSQVFAGPEPFTSPRKPSQVNQSKISFNQSDSEQYRPLKAPISSPGGNSTLSLAHPDNLNNQTQSPSSNRQPLPPSQRSTLDLSFNPEANAVSPPPRRARVAFEDLSAASSSIDLSHSFDRGVSLGPVGGISSAKRHQAGALNTSYAMNMGNDGAKVVLESYRASFEDPAINEIDSSLLNKVSHSVHSHSARLRHTYQQFNKNASGTLSKTNFVSGLKSLSLPFDIPDSQVDLWFRKFDSDLDGEITYTEFVRMMTKTD